MFYLANYFMGKYGVVDTKDGVIEYINESDFKKYKSSLNILTQGWYEGTDDFSALERRMVHKLYMESNRGNIQDFLDNHVLPFYDFKLFNKGLIRKDLRKFYAYNETLDLNILVFDLFSIHDKKLYSNIVLSYNESMKVSNIFCNADMLSFDKCSCGSGFYHENRDKKVYGLSPDTLYLRLYNPLSTDTSFLSIPSLELIK